MTIFLHIIERTKGICQGESFVSISVCFQEQSSVPLSTIYKYFPVLVLFSLTFLINFGKNSVAIINLKSKGLRKNNFTF